jgi:glutathione S-transferase
MSKLRVWGHPRSINVQKVLWALDELGLDYERVDAGGTFGRVKDADYLTLNPNGLIPTLEDGSAVLWESNSIVRYLYTKYGTHPALPSDLGVRGRADGWTDWYTTTFWANVRPLVVQLVRTPADQRDAKLVESSLRAASAAADILERELGKKPYLAGDHFSFGDIPVASASQRWFNLPVQRAKLPAFEAWYARVKERPGFKRWLDLPLA